MSHREFNHLLSSLNALSPEQLATLRRELDNKIASPPPDRSEAGRQSPPKKPVFDATRTVRAYRLRQGYAPHADRPEHESETHGRLRAWLNERSPIPAPWLQLSVNARKPTRNA